MKPTDEINDMLIRAEENFQRGSDLISQVLKELREDIKNE